MSRSQIPTLVRPLPMRALRSRSARPALLLLSTLGLAAQMAIAQTNSSADANAGEQVTITGSRIKSLSLVATSPVAQVGSEEISLWRAGTVEDFSVKLPQLAGGVNGTSAGSDAFGAQTLDLRNLGQSRTLVLINGTRAVPFSIRNAVDVNFIPATLIKRVDLLTGGAAAVYGADAVAGVVNFIMNDTFTGVQVQSSYRSGRGGGAQYGANLTAGMKLGENGNVVGYVEYTKREGLLAGERDWARANPTLLAPRGGNFTDVASGRKFSVDDAGQFTLTPQRSDYTPAYTLLTPMERLNASAFMKLDLSSQVQAYGRAMFSNVKTTGAPRSGQAPVVINAAYPISTTNPFIPTQARPLLTFVNGVANVNVERSLGELGVKTADNDRDTWQLQFGLRGDITETLGWDVYAQSGRSAESITVHGDGAKAALPGLIDRVDIFGPGADLSGLAQDFKYGDRKRTQTVVAATVSGDSSALFRLPAGPVGFALGAERRHEKGQFDYNQNLGQSFNQGVETPPAVPPYLRANEWYAELLVPVLAKLPGIKSLSIEGAYRRSSYDKSVGASNTYGTQKLGVSWAASDDLLLRGTRQTVIREPNFGEFANPVFSIPFANLVSVARLRPRYQGDPCVLGTGNLAQCQRFGAPAVGAYDSLSAAQLAGGYFFGGNPDIRAEKGKTTTFGLVLTPAALPGFTFTADYYQIKITDAVGQIQPVDALTSCYITDPRADNPLCAAVTRDPTTGRIKDGFPVDRNLALIEQSGVDVEARYRQNAPFGLVGHSAALQLQASIVRTYLIQKNPILDPIDCKGTYGFRCSSDAVSLVAPAYRHRTAVTWSVDGHSVQLGWKRIGKVVDSTVGSDGVISAQDTFDLNLSARTPIAGLTVNFGIDNLFDKSPPLPRNPGSFNTYADTYNVVGRSFGLAATMKF